MLRTVDLRQLRQIGHQVREFWPVESGEGFHSFFPYALDFRIFARLFMFAFFGGAETPVCAKEFTHRNALSTTDSLKLHSNAIRIRVTFQRLV